jgi:hypothetical protein
MCTDWKELFVRIFLIFLHLKIQVSWKNVLHQPVCIILTFQNKYIFHLAKTSYHRLHYVPQTVPEWCCIAHCSLFMPFIHCRHSFVIYGVSKQHKHHSSYPSMGHCYGPVHFAELSPKFHFNNTFTHKTASHKPSGMTKFAPVLMLWVICMCIGYHTFTFRCLMEEGQSSSC